MEGNSLDKHYRVAVNKIKMWEKRYEDNAVAFLVLDARHYTRSMGKAWAYDEYLIQKYGTCREESIMLQLGFFLFREKDRT